MNCISWHEHATTRQTQQIIIIIEEDYTDSVIVAWRDGRSRGLNVEKDEDFFLYSPIAVKIAWQFVVKFKKLKLKNSGIQGFSWVSAMVQLHRMANGTGYPSQYVTLVENV